MICRSNHTLLLTLNCPNSHFILSRHLRFRPHILHFARGYIAPAARQRVTGYPERLLIYHSGTGKTVILGCLKITTIFLFAFSSLIVAPAFYFSPDSPTWIAGAAVLGGAIPMIFVTYTTTPFVHYVHLQLPIFARASKDVLHRYIRHLPADAKLQITTMRFTSRPRISTMKLCELEFSKGRIGVANLKRVLSKPVREAKRPWWMGKPLTEFYVKESEGLSREKGAWESVLGRIKQAS